MGQRFSRGRLWVDPAFQFRLLIRLGLYFLLYILVVVHVGFAFQTLEDLAANGARNGVGGLYLEYLLSQRILLITLVVTAPIIGYSMLKFSHRVAGPLFRCRRVMQQMAEGKAVPQFTARKHDLMRELFEAFNGLIREWNDNVRANGIDPDSDPGWEKAQKKDESFQEIAHSE
jgi:hypothetical protein